MARVEQIRDLEFEGNVTLEVITRDEYRNRSTGLGVSGDPWNEQVWEGLLLVARDRQVESAFGDTFNSSVQGYYAPGNDSIVIVSDSETPTIDRGRWPTNSSTPSRTRRAASPGARRRRTDTSPASPSPRARRTTQGQ